MRGGDVKYLVFKLVTWLCGQYDSIQVDLDEAERASSKFLLKWGGSPMMVKSSMRPKWNYQAPRWTFPLTTPNIVHGM